MPPSTETEDTRAPRRRIPWWAVAITLIIIVSSSFAVSAARDVESGSDAVEAYLSRPGAYVALAPLSTTLDTLTLLSATQHIAVFAGALVLFAGWRVTRWRRRRSTARGHVFASVGFLLAVLVTYACVAALPRPMAALVADDAHILILDFHSHTSASHDGRAGFTVERNRAWHRDAGYNVAWITDHASVDAAERGIAANPRPASEGVTLLQSIEVTWTGEHVSILGAERVYRGLLTANKRDVDVEGLQIASMIGGREPIVIWNHPRQIDRLPIATNIGVHGVRAVEIVSGAPDNRDDIRRNRPALLRLAQERNLALTAGSDNHGWGRAAPGWTLMRIYGWRGMHGDSLATQIERVIRDNGFAGTRVIERTVADPGTNPALLAASVFTVPARMFTTLSADERIAWVVWTWLLATALWLWRRRRTEAPAAS